MAIIDMENSTLRDAARESVARTLDQNASKEEPISLRATIESVITRFLEPFNDENTKTSDMKIAQSINKNILFEVEAGMYEAVMHYCKGNQSKAAKVLGVSRGTLRTKLKLYYGTTHVGLI